MQLYNKNKYEVNCTNILLFCLHFKNFKHIKKCEFKLS